MGADEVARHWEPTAEEEPGEKTEQRWVDEHPLVAMSSHKRSYVLRFVDAVQLAEIVDELRFQFFALRTNASVTITRFPQAVGEEGSGPIIPGLALVIIN
jgi:hypothetical protein